MIFQQRANWGNRLYVKSMQKLNTVSEWILNWIFLPTLLTISTGWRGNKQNDFAIAGISRVELVGNSILMLMAGYETTSSALLFLAYNLAVYKDCQEKLRREVKETIEQYVRQKWFMACQGRNEGGKGSTILRAPNHYGGAESLLGPRKVLTMSQVLPSIRQICFRKTSVSNMGAPNLILAPGGI